MSEEPLPLEIAKTKNIETEPTVLLFSKRMEALDDRVYSHTLLPKLSIPSHVAEFISSTNLEDASDPTFILSTADTKKLKLSDISSTPNSTLYEIQQEIARGGMGVIFKGYQVVLKREVAIKTIVPALVTKLQRESFIEESQITAYLDHPNIVPVYDLGESETGETILVMKFIKGKSWRELMQQEPPEKHLEKHLEILLQVCNAVAFAHSKNIVHNDLKPENIMVGEFGEVFVMDWGLATSIEETSEKPLFRNHKNHIRLPCGTPVYMPPELANGQGDQIGRWTDVYLLGGILYHLLAGHPPQRGNSLGEILLNANKKLPDPLSASVPKELQQICLKALAKNPKERYATVIHFKEAIQQFLKHRESLVIMEEANRLLQTSQEIKKGPSPEKKDESEQTRNFLYDYYAQAIAGFRQSLKLWPENQEAQTGELQARLEYAKTALQYNDLGLAETQLKQIAPESLEYSQLKQIMGQAQEAKLAQTITQRLSLISFIATCISIPETTFAFTYWLYYGTGKIFEFQYGPFQMGISFAFLAISFGLYRLLERTIYTSNRLLVLSAIYQILGVFCLTLLCLTTVKKLESQAGSIYISGVWLLQFSILIPYTTRFSFISGLLAASSFLLISVLLPLCGFPPLENIAFWFLAIGHYLFAIVAGIISAKKQKGSSLFNKHLHFD